LVKLNRSWKVIITQETAVYKGFRIDPITLTASLLIYLLNYLMGNPHRHLKMGCNGLIAKAP